MEACEYILLSLTMLNRQINSLIHKAIFRFEYSSVNLRSSSCQFIKIIAQLHSSVSAGQYFILNDHYIPPHIPSVLRFSHNLSLSLSQESICTKLQLKLQMRTPKFQSK